jgi:hypothetical protein
MSSRIADTGAARGRSEIEEDDDERGPDSPTREAMLVDVYPHESGFVLSVGPLAVWLDVPSTQDAVRKLKWALSFRVPGATVEHVSVRTDAEASAKQRSRGAQVRVSSKRKGF